MVAQLNMASLPKTAAQLVPAADNKAAETAIIDKQKIPYVRRGEKMFIPVRTAEELLLKPLNKVSSLMKDDKRYISSIY